MVNVFIFCPFALENGRGGEISSIELAAGLQKYYNVSIIDTNRFIGEKLLSIDDIEKKIKGVKKKSRMKFATLNIFYRLFDFPYPQEILKLYKIIKKNDVIYFTESNFKTNLMFMFFSLIHRRAKFIIGYRKPIHSKKLISLYNIKFRLSILFFSRFKKRFYHHTISYHAKKFLENFYEPRKVIHIVHGIELADYNIKEIEKTKEKKLKFIYVGYLDDVHKGCAVLVNGLRQLLEENKNLDLFFEFCGVGPLESDIKALARTFPRFVKYNGYVRHNEISEFYKKNDVFLFSSRREPFGRVIIEALASGLLIICTKTYGSIEILKSTDFGFFLNKLTPMEIKEKIFKLYELWLEDFEKFRELKKLANEYSLKNYSFSRELKMFRELIDKIIRN